MNRTVQLVKSWAATEGKLHTTAELLAWIAARNREVAVSIQRIPFSSESFWFYNREEGVLHNRSHSFFSIQGLQQFQNGKLVEEQPIIVQQEIGYLGILCQEFDGVLHFLMQAKIEPGNLNKIQLSPTIQATKSNFTQRHGGTKPPYLDYFVKANASDLILDQIQSEQSSRFYKKRNRNLVLEVTESVDVLPSHRWMTLGQIKALMHHDNLVNMDTRTVLSCLPFCEGPLTEADRLETKSYITDDALFRSIFDASENELPPIFQALNDYKMFAEQQTRLCPLHELSRWEMGEDAITCKDFAPFQVIYCAIAMEEREVKHWQQPLFEAIGKAFFGLFICREKGVLKFLISVKPEVGCFDGVELAPSVQLEAGITTRDAVSDVFFGRYKEKIGVLHDVLLSEEGGRFYHEQNHNVLLEIEADMLPLPPNYFWVTYRTLNRLAQVPHALNIQLRNLLSLLEVL